MAFTYTPAQQKVLDARGHNLLVSAAAGSGKTAVLVERIVRLISEGEQPLDIDRLLVLTFTRAAAAQMRERIGQALADRLREDPRNTHLQRQEVLLHNAQITTIDSFCTFLLRNYFSDIDLDPGFRQIDENESRILSSEILQEYLEDLYQEGDPAFLRCVSYFCPGADDSGLENLILDLCSEAGSHPSPQVWLKERAGDYDVPDEEALFAAPWMQSLVLRAADLLLESDGRYQVMKQMCLEPGGPDICYAFLEEERAALLDGISALREQIGKQGKRDRHAVLTETTDTEDNTETYKGEDREGRNSLQDMSYGTGSESSEQELLRRLWEQILQSFAVPFKRYPNTGAKKYNYMDKALKDAVKAMRDAEKDRIKGLAKKIGSQSPEMILAMMEAAKEPLQTLAALAAGFRMRLQEKKRERHVIDFVDLEHLALEILAERQADGRWLPRRAAQALRSHFAEILIDEYQDSNEVQEVLLQIISGEDEGRYNRFMVGDIKQSIYRFRLARPEIFMEKYDAYRPDDPCTERIELDQNFRSRREVLDCVNTLFMRIMRREVGGVEYNPEVSLKLGAVFPGEAEKAGEEQEADPYRAELLLLDPAAGDAGDNGGSAAGGSAPDTSTDTGLEDDDELLEGEMAVLADEIGALTDRQKEALLIAGRIREIVGTLPVRDEETGELRPARYRDIVILLRTARGWNEDLRAVLAREGIPAYAESREGYFAAEEIRQVLALLRVLDNPRQDIPLYGVLRGYFGNFTDEEIAQIRLALPDGMLYDALCAAAQEREKEAAFLAFLDSWRRRVQYCSVADIVAGLLEETGYQDYCTALPAGAQRTANLRLLRSQADAFTKTDYTGLFQFLRYIDGLHRQEIDYGEANILDENADVVRIMTIHKSKGLEFPVCIVAGLSKEFAFRRFDTSGPMLIDSDWGVGIRYFDPDSRARATTLRREEIAEKIRRDCMGEELRILYVAMTRAKEKLILTASEKQMTDTIKKWQSSMAGFFAQKDAYALSPFAIVGARSCTELILKASMACLGPDVDLSEEIPEKSAGTQAGHAPLPLEIRILTADDLAMQSVDAQFDLDRCEEILRAMEGKSLDEQPDSAEAQVLADRIFFRYPHEELAELCAQTSVSELKHRAIRAQQALQALEGDLPEGAQELFADPVPVPYVPAFVRMEQAARADSEQTIFGEPDVREEEAGREGFAETEAGRKDSAEEEARKEESGKEEAVSEDSAKEEARKEDSGKKPLMQEKIQAGMGARRGTAFHRVLECLDYRDRQKLLDQGSEGLRAFLQALVDARKISREDADLVSLRQLGTFLESPVAARMEQASANDALFREQPFVLGIPADRVQAAGLPAVKTGEPDGAGSSSRLQEEMVTVQGIIDAFFIEDEKIILLDYKTDRVRTGQELADRYRVQLDLYADALAGALGLPVAEKLLYSTALGQTVPV
ncbi:MAG: UvrD-helicase domain-containing protein [Eubacteriales bacterium]|nr:UvrD-helicase domain-containing protein [Eubacteriales bacterium]